VRRSIATWAIHCKALKIITMKPLLIFIFLILFGCEKTTHNHLCEDYEIQLLGYEKQIENQFQEIGQLKMQLENADEYIELLESENDTLKKRLYGK